MSGAVFLDTSAIYALLDRNDAVHDPAAAGWRGLLDQRRRGQVSAVRTHSAVVVESTALVQHRLGVDAVRTLVDEVLIMVEVEWVAEPLYDRAVASLLAARRRSVSLVDWLSFEMMRMQGIDTAFAFDDDFVEQGFSLWR